MDRKIFKLGAGIALGLALILAGAQLFWVNRASPSSGDDYFRGLPTAGTTIGRADAPVLVEEYLDFQCPACQEAAEHVVKPLIQEYVAQGKVRFASRMFPFLGPESVGAAKAAYCAAAQDAFWPYQQVLIAQRGRRNQGTYSDENLVKYAEQVGLDVEKFKECYASEDAAAYAEGSYQRARQLGVPGVPTFFINGRMVNVNSYAALKREIEAALAELD